MSSYKYLFVIIFLIFNSCKNKNTETIEAKPLEITNQELFNYIEYCNDRFEFCIDYPSNFSAQPSSANGDGKEFINLTDDSKIIVFGVIDVENEGLQPHKKFIQEQIDISDSIVLKNGYEFFGEGKNDDNAYFYRILNKEIIVTNEPVNVVYSIQLSYPKYMNKKYTKIWKNLMSNFRFTH